jgi:uncharacterized protein YndB with AHSA1/START domain
VHNANGFGKSRVTTASPARVWSIWSDASEWPRWNGSFRSFDLAGPFESGATANIVTAHGSKHNIFFENVDPPRGFTMRMSGPPLTTFTFICEITPDGTGSRIAQRIVLSGPLGPLFGLLMGKQMASHFTPVLDALAAEAEAAP